MGRMLITIDTPNLVTGPPEGLQTMSPAMLDATNYYQWIADTIQPVVKNHILDVGGGMGCLLSYFTRAKQLYALDIAESSVEYLNARFNNVSNCEVVLGDVTHLDVQRKFINAGVNTILCTNVLEHVQNDAAMLTSFYNILSPQNGSLALLVPAYPWLYGTMDEQAGHYRRYDKQQLSQLVTEAGFKVRLIKPFNALAALGWYINGRIFKKQTLTDHNMNQQIRFYDKALIPIVRCIESVITPPVGLSLIVLADTK